MKTRIVNGELWVLVKVYLAPCGFVAHWFSYNGLNSYEPIKTTISPDSIKHIPIR